MKDLMKRLGIFAAPSLLTLALALTALNPASAAQSANAMFPAGGSGFGAPQTYFASQSVVVPAGIPKIYFRIWGGAGSGAICANASLCSARGGATGGYAEGFITIASAGETIVLTVAAPIAGVSSVSADGTAGNSSSIAAASRTVLCGGGAGGTRSTANGVNPTTVAGGVCTGTIATDTTFAGGTPGTLLAGTGVWNCSGGAAASGPWGVGASSGNVGLAVACSGGAGPMGASGVPSAGGASGGGGYRGASVATNTAGGGGGALYSALTGSSNIGGVGVTAGSTLISNPVISLSIPLGPGVVGSAGNGVGAAATDGGGSGASLPGSTSGTPGLAGFMAGTGACNATGASTTCLPSRGGMFGGGGGAVLSAATSGASAASDGGIAGAGGGFSSLATIGSGFSGGAGSGLIILQAVYP